MFEAIAEDLADRALRKGKAMLQEMASRAALIVAGVATLLMAVGYGVHAGYLALAQAMTPIEAALLVGGILLLIGGTLLVVALQGRKVVAEPKPAPPTPELEALYAIRFLRGVIGGANGSAGRRVSTLALLAAALAAGTMAGRRLK